MINWNDLKYLLATVQAGSYSLAAVELGVNRTTVARRIEALEAQLGSPLLENSSAGYTLTEQGQQALKSARQLEEEINRLESQLTQSEEVLRGSLRVAAPLGLGPEFMQELAAFSFQYPEIRLELINTLDPVSSLNQRTADVAITVGHELPDHISGSLISELERALYASKNYLQQYPAALRFSEHRWIGWGKDMPHTQVAKWMQHNLETTTTIAAHVNSWHALRAAVEEGIGIAHLWCFLAKDMPKVHKISDISTELTIGLWLCHHKDVQNNRRVAAFMQAMKPLLTQRTQGSTSCA